MSDRRISSKKMMRCAIYTRKSSEEGLEQDFNSLHAQREACEAYIASQRHEGWKLVATPYDDGGYSGGSLERPGLQKLLIDIQSGTVDVVVVYKVDRLTRSLTDFARIVESFDARGVSFVSVTQAFNTTTSMGRLTLNVLLSFAQFEREVTGERIRDKIAASKRKGLWMGGIVPVGYRAAGRTLDVVEEDAALVRRIFERFLALRSVAAVSEELERSRTRTRSYVSASGKQHGDKTFSTGHLRTILRNRVYIGEIVHKGEHHPGQHRAIIDREMFDQTQQMLSLNSRKHRLRLNADQPNLLAGLLMDESGVRFSSSHTSKKGQRYRYYVLTTEDGNTLRIPAGDLEALVVPKIVTALTDPSWISRTLAGEGAAPDAVVSVIRAGASLAARLQAIDDEVQREAISNLIESIVIAEQSIEIRMNATAFGLSHNEFDDAQSLPAPTLTMLNPLLARPKDLHLKLAAPDGPAPKPAKWLIKAIARGVTWYEDLKTGVATSLGDIAARENVTERYVAQLIRLAFLDPQIVSAVMDGSSALTISGADVAAGIDLPMLWSEQASALRLV